MNRAEWVRLGGLEQGVTVHGVHLFRSVLLEIHGGPASPYTPFNPRLAPWEQHFIVVPWDQRRAGVTHFRHGSDMRAIEKTLATARDSLSRDLVDPDVCRAVAMPVLVRFARSLGARSALERDTD